MSVSFPFPEQVAGVVSSSEDLFFPIFPVLYIAAKISGLNGNMNDSAPIQENNPKPQLLNKDHWGKGNGSFTFILKLINY